MPAYIYLLAETWTSLQFYYLRDLWRWRAYCEDFTVYA